MLESRIDSSNNWATKLEDVWNEHGFDEQFNLAAREVQFIWQVLPGAHTIEIKKQFQTYFNGQVLESFDERIIFMSMFSDMEWTKNGNAETCLHSAKEVAAFATQSIQARTLVLRASENTWWTANSKEPQGTWRYCRIAVG